MATSLIHYGDPHLIPCAWIHRPTLRDDAFIALDSVVQHCLAEKSDLVVPGDIFDSPNPPSVAVDKFRSAVLKLQQAGLGVFTTQGNHDLVPKGHPKWGVICGAVDADRLTFEAGGLNCHGLDYRHQNDLQTVLADVPPVDVLFGHQLLDIFDSRPGVWTMAAEWVPTHVRLVALNDVHKPLELSDSRGVKFVYPGSSCLQEVSEPALKYCVKMKRSVFGGVDLKWLPLVARSVFEYCVDSVEAVDRLISDSLVTQLDASNFHHLPEAIRTPIVRVSYTEAVRQVIGRVPQFVQSKAHLWLVPDYVDSVVVTGTDTAVDKTVHEVLAEFIDPDKQSVAFSFVSGLISAPNTKSYLASERPVSGSAS